MTEPDTLRDPLAADVPISSQDAGAANQNSRAVLREKWARTPLLIAIAIPLLFIVAAFVFMALSLIKDTDEAGKGVNEYFAAAPKTPDAPNDDIANLQAQIQSLQNQMSAASRDTAPVAGSAVQPPAPVYADPVTMARLSQRINELEAHQQQLAQAANAAATIAALQQASRGPQPFSSQLTAAERSLGDPTPLAPLRSLAEKGVLSEAGLAVEFPAYAAKVHAAVKTTDGRNGLWERILDGVSSIISVRRLGKVDGTDIDAVLMRAELRLNQGDLSGAVTQLDALPADAQRAMSVWLDQARARVLIDTTTRRVTETAFNRLSSLPADTTPAQPTGGVL